jgi:hypothetical protein
VFDLESRAAGGAEFGMDTNGTGATTITVTCGTSFAFSNCLLDAGVVWFGLIVPGVGLLLRANAGAAS